MISFFSRCKCSEVYLHNSSESFFLLFNTAAHVLSEESVSRIKSSSSRGSFNFGKLVHYDFINLICSSCSLENINLYFSLVSLHKGFCKSARFLINPSAEFNMPKNLCSCFLSAIFSGKSLIFSRIWFCNSIPSESISIIIISIIIININIIIIIIIIITIIIIIIFHYYYYYYYYYKYYYFFIIYFSLFLCE